MMKSSLAVAAVGVVTAIVLPSALEAQNSSDFRVAVNVTELTGGLFSSAFSTALRALGDVSVVTLDEHPNYILEAVVLCEPSNSNCDQATSYTVAVTWQEPLDEVSVHSAFLLAGFSVGTREFVDGRVTFGPKIKSAMELLGSYVKVDGFWAAEWGRLAYHQGVQDLVARIDSQCLKPERTFNRAARYMAVGDTAESNPIMHRWARMKSIC